MYQTVCRVGDPFSLWMRKSPSLTGSLVSIGWMGVHALFLLICGEAEMGAYVRNRVARENVGYPISLEFHIHKE